MAKVTEYPRVTSLNDNDVLLVDGPNGTRTILQSNALGGIAKNADDIQALKSNLGLPELVIEGPTATTYDSGDFELLKGNMASAQSDYAWSFNSANTYEHVYIELPAGRSGGVIHIETSSVGANIAAVTAYGTQADPDKGIEESDIAVKNGKPKYSGPSGTPDWTHRVDIGANTSSWDYPVPSGAKGLIVNVHSSGTTVTAPDVFTITYPAVSGTLPNRIDVLEDGFAGISARNDILKKRGTNYLPSDIAQLEQTLGHLTNNGTWANFNDNYKHVVIPVSGGMQLDVVNGNATSYIAILKSYTVPSTAQNLIDYSVYDGYNQRIQINAGREYRAIMPSDARYAAVMVKVGGNDVTPQSISVYEDMPRLKCVLMGDSIAAGTVSFMNNGVGDARVDKPISWAQRVADGNGWDLENIAIGGTGYLDKAPGAPDTDYSSCGFYIARDPNRDFTPYDLVILAYGINDWKGDKDPLGVVDEQVEPGQQKDKDKEFPATVLGAMEATIEAILAKNPACKIIVITPLNIHWQNNITYGSKSTGWARGYDALTNMPTLDEFADKMIEVCDHYGIQYIDMTRYSVLNTENIQALLLDGVHPSAKAHALLARELSKKITF